MSTSVKVVIAVMASIVTAILVSLLVAGSAYMKYHDVGNTVENRLIAEHQRAQNTMSATATTVMDIANISEFRAIADNKTIELQRENPSWTPQQIIQEAADQTREWVEKTLPKQKEDVRVRRKKNISSHPKSASASVQIVDDEPDPETVKDIIEEMKQSRLKHLQ